MLAPSPVRVRFVEASDSFAAAAREYELLWAAEGARIVAAMESVSGLRFDGPVYADTAITAIVVERASSSGYRERPMAMRASYPLETKRATLIHELGHRLQSTLFRYDEQDHGPLFLWIYDVWSRLYGSAFADDQVEVERRRRGPYPATWDSAMAVSADERLARWHSIRDERMARWRDVSVPAATASIDTGRVRVPGSSLFYEAAGAGDAVILLHGGNLDRRMWDAEFAGLRERHRVIRYDARGYGRSGPADTAFRAHDDLLALLDTLRLSRAALVGLSLGGRIAIDFALAHPERVDRLVLAAPGISGGEWAEDGDTAWLVVARQAAARKDSVAVALAWLGSAYIRTALRDSAMTQRVRRLVVDQAPFWGGIMRHRDLEEVAVPAAAERLTQLAAPILLVTGLDDTPFIQDVARAIATRTPNVRRLELPGVGHMVNLEAPEAFLAAVLRFLSR